MANIKTTQGEWDRVKEYFESGLLLKNISQKTGIAIPNISKKAKAEGWAKAKANGQKQTLIEAAVRVRVAKANMTLTEVAIHDEIVDERTKHLQYFNSAGIKIAKSAMRAIEDEDAEPLSMYEHKALAETVQKSRDIVFPPKEASLAVNFGVQSAVNTALPDPGEYGRILEGLYERI